MSAFASPIAYYLERYHQGYEENAWFSLVELEPEALPELMAAYKAAIKAELRAFLLHVIWQHRQPSVIPFLGEALREGGKLVWRQAMDA